MKRPSFQFYPGDWLRDAALRSCSTAARGLWMDMLCFMHEGSPYGYLKVNSKVILPPNLARMAGLTLQETEGCLDELREAGVFQTDEDGAIFSKRMIRDEEVRNKRAMGGKLGGNPALMVTPKVEGRLTSEDNRKPTPSSSSSSSNNKESEVEFPTNLQTIPFRKAWAGYLAYRKAARLKPLLPASIVAQLKKLSAWGHDIAIQAIEETISNGWHGIFMPKPSPAGTFNKPFVKPKAASMV
jgi:hypothetical protein